MAQVKARLELQHSDAQFGKKRGTRGAKDGVNPSARRRSTGTATERRICFKVGLLREAGLEYLSPNLLRSKTSIIETLKLTCYSSQINENLPPQL